MATELSKTKVMPLTKCGLILFTASSKFEISISFLILRGVGTQTKSASILSNASLGLIVACNFLLFKTTSSRMSVYSYTTLAEFISSTRF